MERRRRDDAEHDVPVLLERDQRRPHGNPARVVPRPVDRVDDPPAPSRAGRALLLAEDRVAAALGAEHRPQLVLDLAVGLRHRRQVGLRLDDEVTGAEARERDRVRRVREPQRELEIRAHLAAPSLRMLRPGRGSSVARAANKCGRRPALPAGRPSSRDRCCNRRGVGFAGRTPCVPPRLVDLEVDERDDAGADEERHEDRGEREAEAVVLAGELGRSIATPPAGRSPPRRRAGRGRRGSSGRGGPRCVATHPRAAGARGRGSTPRARRRPRCRAARARCRRRG